MLEVCTQVNIILLNTNFSCYDVIDKSTSIISKDIETGVINDVSLYSMQAKFTKSSQGARKKSLNNSIK